MAVRVASARFSAWQGRLCSSLCDAAAAAGAPQPQPCRSRPSEGHTLTALATALALRSPVRGRKLQSSQLQRPLAPRRRAQRGPRPTPRAPPRHATSHKRAPRDGGPLVRPAGEAPAAAGGSGRQEASAAAARLGRPRRPRVRAFPGLLWLLASGRVRRHADSRALPSALRATPGRVGGHILRPCDGLASSGAPSGSARDGAHPDTRQARPEGV